MRGVVRSTLTSCLPCVQIYVTGHSLGGAVATLAAFDIARKADELGISKEQVRRLLQAPACICPASAGSTSRLNCQCNDSMQA